MVTLDRIEYLNFFNIDWEAVELSGQGMTMVQGKNGAAKSALFMEGPIYALWGSSFRYGPAPGLSVRKRGTKAFMVALRFTVDDTPYIVIRCKGAVYKALPEDSMVKQALSSLESGVTFLRDGEEASLGTVAATQEKLTNLIGMSYRAAINSVFYTADIFKFPLLKDSAKKEILDDLIQLHSLDQGRKASKDACDKAKFTLSTLSVNRDKVVNLIESERANYQAFKRKEDAWGDSHAERLLESKGKIEKAKESLVAWNSNPPETKSDEDYSTKGAEIQGAIDARKEKKQELNQKVQSILDGGTGGNESEYEGQEEEIQAKIDSYTEDRIALDKQLQEILSDNKAAKAVLQNEITKAQANRAKVGELVDKGLAICPTCSQELGGDYFHAIEHADKEVAEAQAALAGFETIVASKKEPCKIQEQLDYLAEAISSGRKDIQRIRIAIEHEREEQVKIRNSRIAKIRGKIELLDEGISKGYKILEKLRKAQEQEERALREFESQQKNLKDRVRLAEEAWGSVKEEKNPYTDMRKESKSTLAELKASVGPLEEKIKGAKQEMEDEEFLMTMFGLKGVRVEILSKLIPFLNAEAQRFAQIMGTKLKVTFAIRSEDESYSGNIVTEVENPDGADSYTGDSSGERRRADVILLFSLLSVASSRGNRSFRQAFFDEVFEHLDFEGQTSVAMLLRAVTENKDSIFVLAHTSDYLGGKMDKVTTVEKGKIKREAA